MAIGSLAIGIGANIAIFGVVDALVLKKLPIAGPDRVVLVDSDMRISAAQLARLRALSTALSSISGIWTIDRSNLTVSAAPGGDGDSTASQARVGLATADYFSTLGVKPILGRAFMPEEDRYPGGRPVAVISDDFWRRRFGRAPAAVGRSLRLNGVSYDIIGVTPPDFTGEWVGMPTDLWVPFALASNVMPEVPGGPDRFPRRVIARLTSGVSAGQAQAATEVLFRQILKEEAGPSATRQSLDAIANARVTVVSGAHGYSPQRERFAQPLAILAAGVGVLLLAACANLANLLLARSAARRRDILVRLAIGSGSGRIIRQMLIESLTLAAAGGLGGLLLAMWIGQVLGAMVADAPVDLAGQGTGLVLAVDVDVRLVAFTVVVSGFAALLFGLAPAISATRVSVSGSLTDASARVVGVERFGPRRLLVAAQIALSLMLVIGAGLFVRTLANLRSEDLGFARERTLLVWTVPGQTGRQDVAIADLWHTVQQRLSAIPGVVSAGAANQAVLRGTDLQPGQGGAPLVIDGEPPKRSTAPGFRSFITPGFFAALGVPIVDGRDFTEQDTETAPRVVIINDAMARFFFPGRSAVRRTVRFFGPNRPPTEIVGVAGDFVKGTPRGGRGAEFATYFPYRDPEALNRGAQSRLRIMLVVLHTSVPPLTVADAVRRELRAIDPELPVLRINTTDQQLDDVLGQDRLIAVLSGAIGTMAAALACLGLFGLISYSVARRTNEIGVRLALGATRGRIVGMILSESGRVVLPGLAAGVLAVLALVRLVSSRLYGVSGTDPWTIAAAIVLLVVVAAFAAVIPARRAASVDPTVALRTL